MLLVKLLIVLLLLFIVASLIKAFYHLSKGGGDPSAIVKALTFRIGLSLLLLVFIFLAAYFGALEPHGFNQQ